MAERTNTTKIQSNRLTRWAILVTSVLITICPIHATNAAADEPLQRYNYKIHDSLYGDIGSYSNTVVRSGKTTTVATEAHIKVTFLGVTLYRQEVSRTERWVSDRFVSFHGVTVENGKTTEINGWVEADHFIVSSPIGKFSAPSTIRSANPWFAATTGGDTILMPDTGLIDKMHTSGGDEITIKIDGAPKRVSKYQIETEISREQYQVWIDDSGTPVMFNIKDHDGTDTFTLIR